MVYFWYFIFNPLTVGIHLPATELEEQGLKLNAKKKKKDGETVIWQDAWRILISEKKQLFKREEDKPSHPAVLKGRILGSGKLACDSKCQIKNLH